MRERVICCWSGGKDSALALHRLRQDERYDVAALLTTCVQPERRVSMHGVRIELVRQQADAAGLPLETIELAERPSNGEYETKMAEYLRQKKDEGVVAVAFGDIFLEDLREWREANLAKVGLRGLYPLWKEDSRAILNEFLALRFASVVCCADDAYFGEETPGRIVDRAFIEALPANVDPCGENGEFHTFVYDGPIFARPITFSMGKKLYRPLEGVQLATPTKGFWHCELLPN